MSGLCLPAGLAGRPDSDEGYAAITLNNSYTLFIEEKILLEKVKENRLGFYIEGYGRFELKFDT